MDSKITSLDSYTTNSDQSAFVLLEKFNLFLYTRKGSDVYLILRRSPKTKVFKEIRGKANWNKDSAILYAVCRKMLQKTGGLFNAENLQYFLSSSTETGLDTIKLCAHTTEPFPGVDTNTFRYWMKTLTELDVFFQIPEEKRAVYFVEIPEINIEKLNAYCKDKELPFEFAEQNIKETVQDKSSSLNQLLSNSSFGKFVEDYIIAQKPVEYVGKYGFFNCSPRTWNNLSIMGLYYSHLKKPFEKWDFFDFTAGSYPTADQLKEYKAVVTPGSISAAYDETLAWRPKAMEVYRDIYHNYKNILILGVCFGAQIFAEAMGGKVEKMTIPFVRGPEIVKFTDDFYQLSYLKNLNVKKTGQLAITQAHGDHICRLPEGAIALGTSKTAEIEVFVMEDRMLGLQGHPEYNSVHVAYNAARMKKYAGVDFEGKSFEFVHQEIKRHLFPEFDPDQEDTLGILFNFIKRKIL